MIERHKRETQERQFAEVRFALSESDAEKGTFRGLASVFDVMIDAYVPTIIHRGAFAKTLQENAHRVRILWQHDAWEPIGRPVSMQETQVGLEVEGKISDVARGRDCLTLMRDGVITDLSIGFDPIRFDFEEREGAQTVRHIHEARLWEFSAVTWGANAPARIQSVHQLERLQPAELLDLFTSRLDGADPAEALRLVLGPILAREIEAAGVTDETRPLIADAIGRLEALQRAAEPQPSPTDDEGALTARRQELLDKFAETRIAHASLGLG